MYCKKCKKETKHHYFMMFPVGVMVCNVCGEPLLISSVVEQIK